MKATKSLIEIEPIKLNFLNYFLYFIKSLGKLALKPLNWQSQIKKVNCNFQTLRLALIPRYTPATIQVLGKQFKLVDSFSFIGMYKEIIDQEIYKFQSDKQAPFIIDCGANVGLSILYFKHLFPKSKIIAFEPDQKIFSVLSENIEKYKLANVQLIPKAVWDSETILDFLPEGGDSGRLFQDSLENYRKCQVEAIRLRDYLSQPIDLLKIDIEGAETRVIQDCSDLLYNVKKLFVEYHSFIDQPQTLNILIDTLCKSGFKVYFNMVNQSSQPFYRRIVFNKMDLQLNIFALRE